MKTFITFTLLLTLSTTAFCQKADKKLYDSSQNLSSKEYLQKSRTQKVGAFILLGVGLTTLTLISRGHASFDALPILAIAGTAATLASIPFFIASGRNKKRAMAVSANLSLSSHAAVSITLRL